MFRKIVRFIGTTFGFALMIVAIAFVTSCLSIAANEILFDDVIILEISEIKASVQDLGIFSFVSDIINWFFDFLYNESLRNVVVLAVVLWSLALKGIKGSQAGKGKYMNFYTWGAVKRLCKKMTKFPKRWWFWLICAVTLFTPVIIACTLACCLYILSWIANIVLAPIMYIVMSYYVALTSK